MYNHIYHIYYTYLFTYLLTWAGPESRLGNDARNSLKFQQEFFCDKENDGYVQMTVH